MMHMCNIVGKFECNMKLHESFVVNVTMVLQELDATKHNISTNLYPL
jgi:hypothetical protein